MNCYPWFRPTYLPILQGTQTYIRSGCSVGANGNISCSPESMRANAERQLQAKGLFKDGLSLATYTLARYMQGEVGSGTLEERVAVGEAAVNRAKLERLSQGVLSLLLYRQPAGHPNRGYYGPIHGVGTGTSSAPYGRWATTSADPTILTLLLADLVMTGQSRDFAKGADDQDGPEYWIPQGQTALTNYVKNLASKGKYWVGPLPGIDHWHTFLQFTPDPVTRAASGKALMQRGIEALTLPRRSPSWGSLPICGKPMSTGQTFFLAMLGLALGTATATLVARRYIAQSPSQS